MNTKRKKRKSAIRVISVQADAGFADKLGYRADFGFQTYLTPITITYQKLNAEGQFDDLPKCPLWTGAIPIPDEIKKQLDVYDAAIDRLPQMKVDFAEVLFWALGSVIADYDETTEKGIVAVSGNLALEAELLSAIGMKYMNFETAFNMFEENQYFAHFVREKIAVK